MNKNNLTNSVNFIRELPGTERSRVRSDALVEQVDDVAVPASLSRRHSFDVNLALQNQKTILFLYTSDCRLCVYLCMNLGLTTPSRTH